MRFRIGPLARAVRNDAEYVAPVAGVSDVDQSLAAAAGCSSSSKCPRRCSQASTTRLGAATITQITKNSGQPVAVAT